MANNVVSEWLHITADLIEAKPKEYVCATWTVETARDYAAKLDRLVEAAERYKTAAPMPHFVYCTISTSATCSCGASTIAAELRAALDAIKLPEDNQNDKRN